MSRSEASAEDSLSVLTIARAASEPLLVELFARVEDLELVVAYARSFSEGLELAGHTSFDVMLLELALATEELDPPAEVPLILLAMDGAATAPKARGAVDFLDPHELTPRGIRRAIVAATEPRRRARAERKVASLTEELAGRRAALTERIKELRCLYEVSKRLLDVTASWEVTLQAVVEHLPSGFQHPEHMGARVSLAGSSFASPGFVVTPWSLRAAIQVDEPAATEDTHGELLVCFLSPPSDGSAPNFLDEEGALLEAVADRLGEALRHRLVAQRLARSEAYFRAVTERGGVMMGVVDAQGVIQFVGEEVRRGLGLEPEALRGRSLFSVVHSADDLRRARDVLDAAIRSPGTRHEGTAHVAFGDVRRQLDYAVTSLLHDPAVEGVVISARDVTERVETDGRLRFQAALLDQVGECVFATDDEHRVIYWNRAAAETLGWSWDEVAHQPLLDKLVLPEHRERALAIRQHILETGRWEGELALRTRDGAVITLRGGVLVVADPTRPERPIRICSGRNITELRRAAAHIDVQAKLLDAVGQAVIATDPVGQVTYWNRAAHDLFGWSPAEALGRSVVALTTGRSAHKQAEKIVAAVRDRRTWNGELVLRHKDGREFPGRVDLALLLDDSGAQVGFVGVSSDLTEHKALQEQLLEAQKMEAVGQLAGGVAHDFNNVLTAIQGHVAILLAEVEPSSPQRRDLEEVRDAARRAAELTRQLLAFSRRQILRERVLDVNVELAALRPMLERLLPTSVSLRLEPSPEPALIRADATQLQHIVLNLAVNANDAMGGDGTLVLRVERAQLSEADVATLPWRAAPGDYVRLTVSDTGHGMSKEVLERIFEPFFTTKPLGQGTGLGLSTVYGIVKQSGGHVFVESSEGVGTTFRVLFPETDEELPALREGGRPLSAPPATAETVLVVEDDDAVRRVVKRYLEHEGHRVLEAPNGERALAILHDDTRRIDVVLSDVVMPVMGGVELVAWLQRERPATRVILTSGYSRENLEPSLAKDVVKFLPKPFTLDQLLKAVRQP